MKCKNFFSIEICGDKKLVWVFLILRMSIMSYTKANASELLPAALAAAAPAAAAPAAAVVASTLPSPPTNDWESENGRWITEI